MWKHDQQGVFPGGQGATIGVDFMIKTLTVNGIKVKLQIWDTAGQERFRSITQSYYRSAHSLILVYDISSQPSFDSLPQWCRDIDQFAAPGSSSSPSSSASKGLVKVLVGNKCDKDRDVPRHIAESFADAAHFDLFMETSALDADNVENLFKQIAEILVTKALNSHANNASNANHTSDPQSLFDRSIEYGTRKSSACLSCQFS